LALTLASLLSGSVCGQDVRKPDRGAHERPAAYENAFRLLQQGQAAEALAEIDVALTRRPGTADLWNLRGLAQAQLGKSSDAEGSFRKVIELTPRSPTGYTNLATLFSQQGRLSEAAEIFRQALREQPEDFTALLGLGVTLAAQRQYNAALPYLRKAWTENPGDFQAGYEYAHVLHESKRAGEARQVLAGLGRPPAPALTAKYFALSAVLAEDEGDTKAAVEFYRRAYELAPQNAGFYFSLARAALRLSPEPNSSNPLPAPPEHLTAEQHFALGLLFASFGDYAPAVPQFEQTLNAEPESYNVAFNLALSYKGAGRNADAIELCTRTLRVHPSPELYDLLATLEESCGRYLDAIRHFQRAVELNPTSEQYLFDLGTEYLVHYTFVPANETFRVGTRKFPSSARQFLGLGYANYAQRQYSEAAEAFLMALEIDPASPQVVKAWNSLPEFLSSDQWEKFLPRLRCLAKLHPQTPETLFCYGIALYRSEFAAGGRGGYELAQSLLERTVACNPDFPEVHLELGNLYAARGEKKKAEAELREAIKLQPDSEMAHYRLGQIYRDQDRLAEAQKELALYTDLSRRRREEMARTRSAIKQFILAQSPGNSSQPKTSF
jgi:tetratricopeptide (TPR) repeat protein